MTQFTTVHSHAIPLPVDNIDTDQIIPARFLKGTDKLGLGQNLFSDWRYTEDGAPRPDFILNRPEYQGAQILLAGDNFGCGSSREHAPWALVNWGIRVVISTSFADIFKSNALKNGLLPVVAAPETHFALFEVVRRKPLAAWSVDLEAQQVTLPDGAGFGFSIDPFARTCLLQGIDQLGYILSFSDRIADYEAARAAG